MDLGVNMGVREISSALKRCAIAFALVALAASAREPGAHSYIVRAATTEAARVAVVAAGGAVTHELRIIDSVAARLTPTQRARLEARRDVRSVFADAPVKLASLTSTVGDNFNQARWTNDDGTHRWATAWTETGDDGQALTGKSSITLSLLESGRLSLTGSGTRLARRASLPPGAVHATLSFDAQRISLESNDFVSVQASGNGGIDWTEVGRLAGPANDGSSTRVSFDVSPFISSDTAIP